MCRARPGPRCSPSGLDRWNKAIRRYTVVHERYAAAEAAGGTIPRRLRQQMSKATLRKNAAGLVYWTTPTGQDQLRVNVEVAETELASRFGSSNAMPDASNAEDHRDYVRLTNRVRTNRTRLEEGVARRANSYADMYLVKDERSILREQATARGGHMSANAHPLSSSQAAAMREGLTARGVTLRSWDNADVARASSWVEHGSAPLRYRAAPEAVPAVRGRNANGEMIQIGSAVEGEPAQSKMLRVNSPDGSVVEGRHDFHLTKNSSEQYVVSLRSHVATSWEDASPIDVTKQELGHIMTNTTVGTSDSNMIVGTYSTLTAARAARTSAKRSFSAPKVTAIMGRDVLTERAEGSENSLQRRGIVVWHRYNNG